MNQDFSACRVRRDKTFDEPVLHLPHLCHVCQVAGKPNKTIKPVPFTQI